MERVRTQLLLFLVTVFERVSLVVPRVCSTPESNGILEGYRLAELGNELYAAGRGLVGLLALTPLTPDPQEHLQGSPG